MAKCILCKHYLPRFNKCDRQLDPDEEEATETEWEIFDPHIEHDCEHFIS